MLACGSSGRRRFSAAASAARRRASATVVATTTGAPARALELLPRAQASARRRLIGAGLASAAACGAGALALVAPPASTSGGHELTSLSDGGRQTGLVAAGELSRRRLVKRALWVFWSFVLVLVFSPAAWLSRDFCERVYYRLVYRAICYSRSAALVKWSQWASVRFDLFPATLCLLLGQLQASAPTHSFGHTLEEIQSAGLRVAAAGRSDLAFGALDGGSGEPGAGGAVALEGLEEVPFASGSIAQVHTAYCGGERVVVKVRHPRVNEELILDFELMRRSADAIHRWFPSLRWMNAPATVSQFEAAMVGQCDLSHEASNLNAFRDNFRRKAAWIIFPKVFSATPGVLVESYESGELMSEFVEKWRGQELPDDASLEAAFVISRGEDTYLQMLLVDNFMHADLHPGNILFRKVGVFGKPQVIVLDAGMAAYLTNAERTNFIGLLQAIGDGDGGAVAQRVLCFSKHRQCSDAEAFTSDVRAMCAQKCRGYGTGLDIGEVMRHMMQIMFRHSVPIDGNYATLIANMLCLDGMARDLEPRFNVLDVAYPLLRAHQILGDNVFQRAFSVGQYMLPPPAWDSIFRLGLYAAIHGDRLKRFQI